MKYTVAATDTDRLMTVAELGEKLRAKPPKVRALARRGEIAFVRVGKAMLFYETDVDAYLQRVRRPARWERGEAAIRQVLG